MLQKEAFPSFSILPKSPWGIRQSPELENGPRWSWHLYPHRRKCILANNGVLHNGSTLCGAGGWEEYQTMVPKTRKHIPRRETEEERVGILLFGPSFAICWCAREQQETSVAGNGGRRQLVGLEPCGLAGMKKATAPTVTLMDVESC